MRYLIMCAVIAISVFCSVSPSEAVVLDDENCMMCHKYPGMGRMDDHGELRLFYVESDRYADSVHTRVKCTGCHADIKEVPHKEAKPVDCSTECHINEGGSGKPFSHEAVVAELKSSIHNPDNPNVNDDTPEDFPTCTGCHRNPEFRPLSREISKIEGSRSQERIYEKCDVCHDTEDVEYRYFYNHVTHRVKDLEPQEEVVAICSRCHGTEEMAEKHELKNAGSTYLDTFHGKAVEFGFANAPTCIDCHVKDGTSVHRILSHKDPESAVHEDNRAEACQDVRCHPNVNKNFGDIRMHVLIDKNFYPVEFYTALGFTVLTLGAFFPLVGLLILELIREMFPTLSLRRKTKKQ